MKPARGQLDLFGGGHSARSQYEASPDVRLNSTVSESDTPRLRASHKRLLTLLSDHQWHTNRELEAVAGNRYGARLNELKDAGHAWVKEHVSGGTWRYRLLERGEAE